MSLRKYFHIQSAEGYALKLENTSTKDPSSNLFSVILSPAQ